MNNKPDKPPCYWHSANKPLLIMNLPAVANAEYERSKTYATLKKALVHLRAELEDIRNFWSLKVSRQDDGFNPTVSSRSVKIPFRALVEQCRDRFLNMQPYESVTSEIVFRWRSKNGVYNGACLYNND